MSRILIIICIYDVNGQPDIHKSFINQHLATAQCCQSAKIIWLKILFTGCENLKTLRIYDFDHNLNVIQVIGVKCNENIWQRSQYTTNIG